jgi:Arc/MetJ family transcription regulator
MMHESASSRGEGMRTTVTIDPKLLAEAEQVLNEHGVTNVVNAALREVVRRRKLQDLRQLLGTMDVDDTWAEDEGHELAEMDANQH